MELRVHTVGLLMLTCLVLACATEPRTYDECILRYVKSGMDTAAVIALKESCRSKFPVDGRQVGLERDLTPVELAAITGRAAPSSFGSSFSGQLYNGNTMLSLTEIEISVAVGEGLFRDSRLYRTRVSIGPLSSGSFSFDFLKGTQGESYEWSVSRARGIPHR